MKEHHIWCNLQQGLAANCRQCASLNKSYPQIEGDDGTQLLNLYFKPDNCELCHGEKGGVRGNENIVDGIVMCDYCSVDYDRKELKQSKK